MYFFIQRIQEFTLKDLLFKRYSNVAELLGTFSNFREMAQYFASLFDKSMDEELYEFYLHKSMLSDISYQDFKGKVVAQIEAEKMTKKDVNDVMQWAFNYIEPRR